MSNTINESVYELTDTDFNIVTKLKYFIKLTKTKEKTISSKNKSVFSDSSEYMTETNINKYVILKKEYFKTQYSNKPIFKEDGTLIHIENKIPRPPNYIGWHTGIDFDYYAFKIDYERDIKYFNIFIICNNKYYQINNKYIEDNYINKVKNVNQNNYKETYNIYNKYLKLMTSVLLYILKKSNTHPTQPTHLQNSNLNVDITHMITLLYILLTQSFNADFIIHYYEKLYKLGTSTQDMQYTNIIIDLDKYIIYKLTSIKYIINTDINNPKHDYYNTYTASNDQCYTHNICTYHIIKCSYNPKDKDITVLLYSLLPEQIHSTNRAIPTNAYNPNLMLYTKYSYNNYKYNNYTNLLNNYILFLNI